MMASSAQLLLSEPSKEDEGFSKSLKRHGCPYESHCERFRVGRREFAQQYSHLYFVRLQKMKKRVESVAREKWGEDV